MTQSMQQKRTVTPTAQLELLYGSLPLSVATNVLLAVLLSGVLWPVIDLQLVSIWLVLLVLLQAGRMWLWLDFRRVVQIDAVVPSGWLGRFRVAAVGTGLLWGLATWLFFPDNFTYQVFMAFVLAGLSAGAATSLAPDRPSVLGFVALALSPLIFNFAIQGDSMSLAMGAMIALFLFFVIVSGSRLRRMLQDNEALVQDTRQQQQALKAQRQLGEVITRVQSRFIHDVDRSRAFDQLLSDILELTGSEYGFIGEVLLNAEGEPYLKTYAITNIAWNDDTRTFYADNAPQGMEFRNLDTLFGAALSSGEPVIANDPYHDPRRGGLPEGHPALNAFLGVPVYHAGKQVAMLGIANRPGGYDHELLDFLSPLLVTIGQLVMAAQDQQRHHEDAERLRASERRLASVIEGTHIGTWEWNVQTGETVFNERWAEIAGYSLEELAPISIQTWMDLAHPDDLQQSGKLLEQHFADELDFYDCVARMRHKDGHWVWVHDRGRVVSWTADGKPLLMSGTHADVTVQKKAEQELKASEARLRGLFELSPIGIALNDYETGAFIDLNDAVLRPAGYSRDEFTALSYWEITPQKYEPQERQQLQSMEKTGRYGPYEKEYIRKDGSRYPVLLNGMVVYDSNGRKLIWSIIEDISERKRIERMKNEFISTVSHELRTPLTAISGALGLVVGGATGDLPEQMRDMLDIAHKNSQRLGILINDLLDMEKLVAGKMRFEMKVQALQPLLEQAIQDNQPYAEFFGVRLCPGEGAGEGAGDTQLKVDAHRLSQVLANLISNAVKFSPEGGKVTVTVANVEAWVRVSVTDHGPGVPEAFRKHVFQKFAQADASDSRQKSGTGLGLAITRELVERMGGRVGFDSVEGEGASFWFELALADISQPELSENDAALMLSSAPRILVVEDEPDVAKVLAMLLTRSGYRVDVAHTGQQAMTALADTEYDALTLDLMLPDISGLEVIRQLRQQPRTADLPIVVVSARMEEGKLSIKGDFSAVEWLAKPIDEPRLLQTLELLFTTLSNIQPRILHVEDDGDLHQVIRTMVGGRFDFDLASTLREARERIALERYDVIILDVGLPDGSGWDLLLEIRARQPEARVVILSGTEMTPDEARKVEAVLLKSQVSPRELLDALTKRIHNQIRRN